MGERPTDGSGVDAPGLATLLARQGPDDARNQLGNGAITELVSDGSAAVEATVVVGDLRLSALLLKEAVQPALYARFLVGFTEAVRTLAKGRSGWFDKFTGDGFIAFWLHGPGAPGGASAVPEFCQTVMGAADSLIANLRRNSRNFPVGVGLALGVDSGPCQLVQVGDSLTLVGAPIVGASRMVGSAHGRQTLVNVYLGEELERARERLADGGIRVERATVHTKEYPDGQEAYELIFQGTRRSHPAGETPAVA